MAAGLIAAVAGLGISACGSSGSSGGGGGGSSQAGGGSHGGTLNFVVFEGFSGPNAAFGPESMDPCLAAQSLINGDGGVLGGKVNCVAADSRSDPADAVPVAGKVVATGHAVGILGPDTNTAPPTVPIFNSAHIPMFSSTGSSQFDRQTSYPYFWRLLPPDKDTGYALAIGLHDAGISKVASVFGDAATNQTNVAPLTAGFTKLGGQVTSKLTLASGQGSYDTPAARVASAHPQAIATEADAQTSATFFSQLQQQMGGKLPPIWGTSATQEPDWLSAVGKSIGTSKLAKIHFIAVPYAPFSGPVYDNFKKALLATHTKNPVQYATDIFSLAAFDAVNVMSLCMIKTHSTDPATFNKCIPSLTNPNPSATVVHDFASGKAALGKGKTIRYVGVTGPIVLNQFHNSPGQFAIVKYTSGGANGQVAVQRVIPSSQLSQLAASAPTK